MNSNSASSTNAAATAPNSTESSDLKEASAWADDLGDPKTPEAERPKAGIDHASDDDTPAGRGLISRLLPPAIRLWLSTQLDHLEGLEFRLEGKDRQILSGHIPQVSLSAQRAVYQGLHVSQVSVTAQGIRVNLGQVLRGKPLRLLQAFPVEGRVSLLTEDVRASLHAPLLEQGLQDIFQRWTQTPTEAASEGDVLEHLTTLPPATQLTEIALGHGTLTLTWALDAEKQLRLHTHLTMQEGRYLSLGQTEVQGGQAGAWSSPNRLGDVMMDLGTEAQIHRLAVTPQAIEMEGMVRVIP